MSAVVDLLVAVGLLHLAGAQLSPEILKLRQEAVAFQGELPCPRPDCDCAFRHVGCCCASGRMRDVQDHTRARLVNMWQSVKELGASVQEALGGRRVAFTASGVPQSECFGPFSVDVSVPYVSVALNHGNGYNPALGTFTAPLAGIFSFSFTAYSSVAAVGDRMYHQLQLRRDGELVASAWEDNRQDSEDSSTHTLVLSLERGAQVYVVLRNGRQLCGDTGGRNAFSGYLVYPAAES